MPQSYDLILVGSGFASALFLERYLAHAGPAARVLVLDRGRLLEHSEHLGGRKAITARSQAEVHNLTPRKPWVFQLAFGGGSNCWFGCTPRMTVEDFRLHSLHGQGRDWPIAYDDLEGFYCDVEERLAIAGDSERGPHRRSRPYPLPPHRFSSVDALLAKQHPAAFFHQPCARPSRATERRPRCCASGVCHECPIDSKFTVLNELRGIFQSDPRVELKSEAEVFEIEHAGNAASGLRYRRGGAEERANATLIALGANAIFNPWLLLRSGLDDGVVGRGLVEQVSIAADVMLDGVDNFDGSTASCGIGYAHHDGAERANSAASLLLTLNVPDLRHERGKWRQRLRCGWMFEDLPQADNRVGIDASDGRPTLTFRGVSDYARRGLERLPRIAEEALAGLPIESIQLEPEAHPTSSHIQCTTPMGDDPKTSVVDRRLLHHRLRNVAVLGSSVFPTCPPANPSLTICALSTYAAEHLR